MEKSFTTQDGINIQTKQLLEWKSILKEECYWKLEEWATKNNNKAENGYNITRGTELDNWIANNLMRKQNY